MTPRWLVTGATGSAGSFFCEYLRRTHPELEVHGTAHQLLGGYRVKGVTYHAYELNSRSAADFLFQQVRPDAVVHFASWARVRESFDVPANYLENNIVLTVNVLDAYRRFAPAARFLHVSTSEVYGSVPHGLYPDGIPESSPLRPVSPYAASKTAQEITVSAYVRSYQLPIITSRAFGYVNPRRPDLVLTSFAHQIVKTGEVRHGNLDSIRTFCDVRDLCEAYYLLLEKGEPGGIYNVGSTLPVRIGTALGLLSVLAGKEVHLIPDPARMRPADVTNQIPDTRLCQRTTGWTSKIPFEASLRWLLQEVAK